MKNNFGAAIADWDDFRCFQSVKTRGSSMDDGSLFLKQCINFRVSYRSGIRVDSTEGNQASTVCRYVVEIAEDS